MSFIEKILDLSLRKIFRRGAALLGLSGVNLNQYAEINSLFGHDQAEKLAKMPRYTPGEVSFNGLSMIFNDNLALFGMFDEIFIKKNYEFAANTNSPIIIDCGANIGVGVVYLKMRYPDARIIAFEPDLEAFNCLSENVKRNNFKNVQLYNKAVWVKDEELEFYSDGSWGGGVFSKEGSTKKIVKAVDLSEFLDQKIDFLKMDIEGAETKVIQHASGKIFKNVERFFFEWHSIKEYPQQLGEILREFEKHGFRYHIKEAALRASPFENMPAGPMDSQLDIFLKKI